jgi:probable rRNA maturation factor
MPATERRRVRPYHTRRYHLRGDPPIPVAVLDEVDHAELDTERATRLFAASFSSLGLDLARIGEVSVVLVSPETIRDLNSRFRDRDEPTDVLSFVVDGPYGEMVGEVVICPVCADTERGVDELVVHGALHLGGMDHGEDFGASEMARVQRAVMEELRGEES